MVKVSVILPVYNVEKYLSECMESIINQSLESIEIICIDDGSEDGSFDVLSGYALQDYRVKIIRTEHGGAAKARNLGMQYAEGEYLCFLDSDDVFDRKMLEELYTSATKFDADVAICEYDSMTKTGNAKCLQKVLQKYMQGYCVKTFCVSELPEEGLLFWYHAAWNKIFRRRFILESQLFFQDLKNANDIFFSISAMILAKDIVHAKTFKPLIHYRRNRIGQITGEIKVKNSYRALKKIYTDLYSREEFKKVQKQFSVFSLYIIGTSLMKNGSYYEETKQFYDFFRDYGIHELGLDKAQEEKKLPYYEQIIQLYHEYSCESEWYKEEKILALQLQKKGLDEIKDMCAGKNVVLWGIGARGLAVLGVFSNYNIHLIGVVDQDKEKRGSIVYGYTIGAFDELEDQIDVVVATSKEYFDSICTSIYEGKNRRIYILPLFMYLESEFALCDCMWKIEELA